MSANAPPIRFTIALIALLIVTAIFSLAWLAVLGDQLFLIDRIPPIAHSVVHVFGAVLGALWLLWARRPVPKSWMTFCVVASGVFVVWWQSSVFICDALGLEVLRASIARWGTVGFFFLGLSWFIWWIDWSTKRLRAKRESVSEGEVSDPAKTGVVVATFARPLERPDAERNWNPFDLNAWYYGRTKKLNQSIWAITVYSFSFIMALFLLTQLQGCREIYEMPAGGGEQQQVVQQIKVQKIIRKKFVINPYSAIAMKVPKIEDAVKLNLDEATKHQYEVGYGQGKGAGFAGGTFKGKVRFIRLEYNGGDWDQDFGIGGDFNMLAEYGIRTKHKVEKRTESRRIVQLKNFPAGKSPPMVYITGERNISVSNADIKILREYLIEKHGMIFADNGGSRHWENQFYSLMNRVLPAVRPVPIPLDDQVHRIPFPVPFMPLVAPHGARREAMGWYKDGRWICYYHPGDIGDAWADGHAGVKPEVYEACYRLGANVIFYAHTEYSKWLEAQKKE